MQKMWNLDNFKGLLMMHLGANISIWSFRASCSLQTEQDG